MAFSQLDQQMIIERLRPHRIKMFESFLYFTQAMYKLRTGREFEISTPAGRESHYVTISRELIEVMKGNNQNLVINIAPRYGKTEMIINFIAWAMAQYPDSNFMYISY